MSSMLSPVSFDPSFDLLSLLLSMFPINANGLPLCYNLSCPKVPFDLVIGMQMQLLYVVMSFYGLSHES